MMIENKCFIASIIDGETLGSVLGQSEDQA